MNSVCTQQYHCGHHSQQQSLNGARSLVLICCHSVHSAVVPCDREPSYAHGTEFQLAFKTSAWLALGGISSMMCVIYNEWLLRPHPTLWECHCSPISTPSARFWTRHSSRSPVRGPRGFLALDTLSGKTARNSHAMKHDAFSVARCNGCGSINVYWSYRRLCQTV